MELGRAAGSGSQEKRAKEAHERGERVEEPVLHDGGGGRWDSGGDGLFVLQEKGGNECFGLGTGGRWETRR